MIRPLLGEYQPQADKRFMQLLAKVHGPHTEIGRDLIVPAPPCVEFLAEITDSFDELPLDPSVYILGTALGRRRSKCSCIYAYILESGCDLVALIVCEYSYTLECIRPSD
ncbi:MAG: hypothetical protein Phyf2KO_06470 [Phycisphaerales bacterium]